MTISRLFVWQRENSGHVGSRSQQKVSVVGARQPFCSFTHCFLTSSLVIVTSAPGIIVQQSASRAQYRRQSRFSVSGAVSSMETRVVSLSGCETSIRRPSRCPARAPEQAATTIEAMSNAGIELGSREDMVEKVWQGVP